MVRGPEKIKAQSLSEWMTKQDLGEMAKSQNLLRVTKYKKFSKTMIDNGLKGHGT